MVLFVVLAFLMGFSRETLCDCCGKRFVHVKKQAWHCKASALECGRSYSDVTSTEVIVNHDLILNSEYSTVYLNNDIDIADNRSYDPHETQEHKHYQFLQRFEIS